MARSSTNQFEEHVLVVMRTMGHELLLSAGDSTSTVLPISRDLERYKMQFTTDFSFDPQVLSQIVDSVMDKTKTAANYLIEIKNCDSDLVVYSYELNKMNPEGEAPCKGRPFP